jgi:hypothetical protein
MEVAARLSVLAVLFGLWACGSSAGPDGSTPEASPGDSSGGIDAIADGHSTGEDAGPGPDTSVGDAAALDASPDAQEGDGPLGDGNSLDASTFVCGKGITAKSCTTGTEYCLSWSTGGELPMLIGSCKALAPLPCASTSTGCNCSNLPPEVDASSCQCSVSDASSALTLDCPP